MILEEQDCDCGDGSEPGKGFMTVRLCSKCRGIRKNRECATCRATGLVYKKTWFNWYRRLYCDDCHGDGWTPAWADTPTKV